MWRPLVAIAIFLILFCSCGHFYTAWVEKDCAKHDAKPKFTYGLQYLCIDADGRIVG